MEELVVYDQRPLTAVDVRAQVNLIQEVMKSVMQKGQHYGTVPGCGDKPTLLKPGAEKIMSTFRLAADPIVEDLSVTDIFRYRVTCRLLAQSTGIFVGAGLGECSSDEGKYKWRKMVSVAEWDATPEDKKHIKYDRDGEIKQVRTNPADIANTILKMAKKRALVDAVLTVTAASDIFTQDIEDMPAEILNQGKPPIQKPQEKAAGVQTAGLNAQNTSGAIIGEPEGPYASEAQGGRFYAISHASGRTDEEMHTWLKNRYGITSTKKIPKAMYDMICTNVAVKEVREAGQEG